MEQLDLIKITPDGKRSQQHDTKALPQAKTKKAYDDDFFELLSRSQSKRMDDQRCSIKINKNISNASALTENAINASTGAISRKPLQQHNSIQSGSGYSSDAANGASLPGLKTAASSNVATGGTSGGASGGHAQLARSATTTEQPDDTFLDMLMRCQGSRLEEQRSELPRPNVLHDAEVVQPRNNVRAAGGARGGTTVPDEDFFSLIMKVQSGRMEDQRAAIPMPRRDNQSSNGSTK